MSYVNILKNEGLAKRVDINNEFKVVLIGESGVGKTSIFNRVRKGIFSPLTTAGQDQCDRYFSVTNKDAVKLVIWDTAGQERFQTITKNYYRKSDAIIFVFAVDDPNSFNSLKGWNDDVERIMGTRVLKVLVGNKRDLSTSLEYENASDFCEVRNFEHHCTTSALKGEGIDEMLDWISGHLYQKSKGSECPEPSPLPPVKTSGCC